MPENPRPILILHGWSDAASSFERLARLLGERLERKVENVYLGDWLSLDDDVTYPDLRLALERAWRAKSLPTSPRSVDVVVHSTGALVARDWMTHFYTPKTVPICHFLMLAPANFGSPLAHKGRAFIGRIIKGWSTGLETGTHVLDGLELASPYTWHLAERDVLVDAGEGWYGAGRILATVLVGNTGYGGVRAAANEDGGDGTVRVSTANLNAELLKVDLTGEEVEHELVQPAPEHRVAFGVVAGETHGSIIAKEAPDPRNSDTLGLMERALELRDADWPAWLAELDERTQKLVDEAMGKSRPRSDTSIHAFQNTVVRLRDNLGQEVPEYFVEFYMDDKDAGFAAFFHRDALSTVHAYQGDTSYRSFYIDVTRLLYRIDKEDERIDISLMAHPEYDPDPPLPQRRSLVGYKWLAEDDLKLRLDRDAVAQVFRPNRTLLVDILIERQIAEQVMEIEQAK